MVEDNPSLLQYLQLLLGHYQVITAENGKTGLEKLEELQQSGQLVNLIRNSRERLAANRPADSRKEKGQKPEGKAILTNADTKWLQEIEKRILDNMGDPQFGISQLADELALSPRRFQQKIKELTGLTPKMYQREIQLEYARRLLESGDFQTVSEVSYQLGFRDAHYFSTLFFKRFGKKPNEYL